MTALTTWPEFLEAVQPFLNAPSPIEAMTDAGFALGGDVGEAFERRPCRGVSPRTLQQHRSELGPSPSMRLYVGRGRRTASRQAGASGYHATATADVVLLNQIVAEFWNTGTIPQSLDQSKTAKLFPIAELRETCSGVPADATGGVLYITAPPVVTASTVSQQNAHISASVLLLLNSATPAAMQAELAVEIPLEFEISPRQQIIVGNNVLSTLAVSLVVAPESTIQPTVGGVTMLDEKLAEALETVLLVERNTLGIPGEIGLGSSFPHSKLTVSDAGGVTLNSGEAQFVEVGVDAFARQIEPSLIFEESEPGPSSNFVIVLHQQLGIDALSTIIASGDLSAYINRLVARHIPFEVSPFVVTGGDVQVVSDSTVEVSVDVKWQGACDFDTDLDFTVSILCELILERGTLTIVAGVAQIDVSFWDEIKCAILAVPVVGTLISWIVDAVANSLSSFLSGSSRSVLISGMTGPLPDSEKVIQFEFTKLKLRPQGGTVRADGQAQVVADTLRTYVYLRLMVGPTLLLAEPLPEAAVELIEIYDFVPIPPTGQSVEVKGPFEVDTSTSYQRLPDFSLGEAASDANGYLRSAVICPQKAGIIGTVTQSTEIHTREVTTITTEGPNLVGWSDLAMKVTDKQGTVLATRRLFATQVLDKRVGTREKPVVVLLHPLFLANPGSA